MAHIRSREVSVARKAAGGSIAALLLVVAGCAGALDSAGAADKAGGVVTAHSDDGQHSWR